MSLTVADACYGGSYCAAMEGPTSGILTVTQSISPDVAWQPTWHAERPCRTERVLQVACLPPGRHVLRRSTGLLCSQ